MADIATNTLQIGGNNLILQDAAVRSSLANAYSASSTYAVGDMVLKDGQLYECNTAISTAEAWTAAHWTAVTVGDELSTVKDGLLDMYVTDTASGAIASFPDGADNIPVKSLAVDIEPVQSGSGDPSPTNIRPISGHTSAVVTVSPTTDAQDGTSYTIDLGGTRYGGTLDVTTGVLTVETEIKTLNGSEGFWSGTAVASGTRRFYTDTSYANKAIVACDSAKISTDTTVLNIICVSGNRLIMTPSWAQSAATIADFKTLLASNNVTIIQTLTTPTTVQLTANEVKTLLGQNNVWNDCGDTEVEYRADTKLYIQKVLNA